MEAFDTAKDLCGGTGDGCKLDGPATVTITTGSGSKSDKLMLSVDTSVPAGTTPPHSAVEQDENSNSQDCISEAKLRELPVTPKRDATPPSHRLVVASTPEPLKPHAVSPSTGLNVAPGDTRIGAPTNVTGKGAFPTGKGEQSPIVNQISTSSAYNNRCHFYDLTPVMRNTSVDAGMNTDSMGGNADGDAYFDDQMDAERQEHLKLPANLDDPNDNGPVMPQLQSLNGERRARSCYGRPPPSSRSTTINFKIQQQHNANGNQNPQPSVFMEDNANVSANLRDPIELPPSGRFHTFTSRDQFEKQTIPNDPPSAAKPPISGLKQYQPCRRQDLLEHGIGVIPQEELNSIFIPRRLPAGNSNSNGIGEVKRDNFDDASNLMASSSDNDSAYMIPPPCPIDSARQWSIPSIRMANHLIGGGSTTTYTEEDEDSILRMDDDASISSRGSAIVLSEDIANLVEGTNAIFLAPAATSSSFFHSSATSDTTNTTPSQSNPILYSSSTNDQQDYCADVDEDYNNQMCVDSDDNDNDVMGRRRRTKEQRVFDWLRTVEASNDVFAEAASSKFLTGSHQHQNPDAFNHRSLSAVPPLCRQSSTPAYPTGLHRDRGVTDAARFSRLQESTST